MSETLIKLIKEGIATKEAELEELRRELREQEAAGGKKKNKRSRKESGPNPRWHPVRHY